jgi:dTDP-glucose pyrophosphorylase
MEHFTKYLMYANQTIREALIRLDELASDATVFLTDDNGFLKGSVTDGDIRRGLIRGISPKEKIQQIANASPKFIRRGSNDIEKIIQYREKDIQILPVLDRNNDRVLNILNLKKQRSYLPVDAVIMAGGKGQRLMPLTENHPKPLLKVGGTAIIERNIDRLALFGIDDITISINYLGDQIETHLGNGSSKGIRINYVTETKPLGTIGSVGLIKEFHNDFVLVMNSDLLTNIDYESFFLDFIQSEAELSVLSIPYTVNIPYAVMETQGKKILSLREKPSYTYYSNGGIYLMKREVLSLLPNDEYYDATDLIEALINSGRVVHSFPLVDYWLDIGNHDDFAKAQRDIEHIRF